MAARKKGQQKGKSAPRASAPRKAAAKARPSLAVRLAKWTFVLGIWGAVALGAVVGWYAYDLPDVSRLDKATRQPGVTVMAADGSVLASFGELHGRAVEIGDVPPYLVQAIIATEDRRFFEHPGLDLIGMARALVRNLRAGAIREGGSTITQQLAKNLFLSPERTIRRKVQETLLALWLEARFTKAQLFAIYINRIYLGAGAYGVAAASQRYFGVPVRSVNLHEAAILAGLLKAPSRYAPTRDQDAAVARARQVLANMVDAGYITAADAKAAAAEPVRRASRMDGAGPHYFADWVVSQIAGFIGRPDRDVIVATTLDPRLQRAAEARVARMIDGPGKKDGAHQAALVALGPDGAVRAMVGGRSYGGSQFNRATQALRQPGSAFKLFVYLAGLEAGIGPNQMMTDGPLTIDGWKPRNYSGRYRGPITLETAFAKSVNTVAVRLSERVGRRKVVAMAKRFGITSRLKSHPSIALGASEVSLIELTSAYGAVANGGRAVWPYGIAEIRDRQGRVLYRRTGSAPPQLVEPAVAATMDAMLRQVVETGTGRAARLPVPAAGKTGTSQEFRDAWFIGYAAGLVTGVWIGNDDSSPMKKVSGGKLPARLWHDFMQDALGKVPIQMPAPAPAPPPVAASPESRVLPAAGGRARAVVPVRREYWPGDEISN